MLDIITNISGTCLIQLSLLTKACIENNWVKGFRTTSNVPSAYQFLDPERSSIILSVASITCWQSSTMMSWQRKPGGIESITNWKSRVVGLPGCMACLWPLAAWIRLAGAASVGIGTCCRSCWRTSLTISAADMKIWEAAWAMILVLMVTAISSLGFVGHMCLSTMDWKTSPSCLTKALQYTFLLQTLQFHQMTPLSVSLFLQ